MINKSKPAVIAAVAAMGGMSPASAEYLRNCSSLLYAIAERLYRAHIEKAQMRLAPTRRLDV